MTGSDILKIAKGLMGRPYVLGAYVPKNKNDYTGPFDCAELVSYCIYQAYGILYGTELNNFSRKNSDDGFTGYLGRDAQKKGIVITVEQAARTPGAIVLRLANGSSIGHTGISDGTGITYEAMSTKYGCRKGKIDGRRFSYGILIPGVEYSELKPVVTKAPAIVYRLKTPFMRSDYVGRIQAAMGLTGKSVDNTYGPKTQAMVVAFQKKKGLIMDGEVMPGGETAKALNIIGS